MAKKVLNWANPYTYYPPGVFETGLAAFLPKAYQKFYYEWKEEPAPVHYVPRAGKYFRNEKTGLVMPVQNHPIPLKYPKEFNNCLLGGEAIIKGFEKRTRARRNPHFWIPKLKKTAVYSQILNKYFAVMATERVLHLIHHYQGFDDYILQTKACDLHTKLALGMKRNMIQALHDGCPAWSNDPDMKQSVLSKYKKYGDQYTTEEAEWYGYDLYEATTKIAEIREIEAEKKIVPLKHQLRANLIAEFKALGLDQVECIVARSEKGGIYDAKDSGKTSWYSKLNPFGKKK